MIGYYLLRILIFGFSWLPFTILYFCSDGLAWVLQHVLHYRRKVILTNLSRSFPELDPAATQRILKKFYRNLSDIILEGIKGMSSNEKTLVERYHFVNPQLITNYFEQGRSVLGLVAHYNNWEWGALATKAQIKGPVIGVSKSIHNKYIDQYIKSRRARFGADIIDMPQTPRAIIQHKERPSMFVLIADQSPSNGRNAHWIDFLNQDTACLPGPDKIARRTNYPVIYFDVRRLRRGYYEIEAILLTDHAAKYEETAITKLYFRQLEKIIRRAPENWLWSHKRWKKRRISSLSSKE